MERIHYPNVERADHLVDAVRAAQPATPNIEMGIPTLRSFRYDHAVPEIGFDVGTRARAARVLLLGEGEEIDRRIEADLLGIDQGRAYLPFHAKPHKGFLLDELASDLQLLHHDMLPVAEHGGDLIGLLLARPDDIESGIVGIGPQVHLNNLLDSFQLASRAVNTAIAFELTGVHEFDELGILPTIVADTDIGNALRSRYLEPVLHLDEGPELVTAVERWLGNGMRVDTTAAMLMLHPNTLRNRISRFEKVAGADLRNGSEAMQVWWALQYVAMTDARYRRYAA